MNHSFSYTIEDLKQLVAELILSQKETDSKFKETDNKFKETEKLLSEKFQETKELIKNISLELGGIGKSNGEIAEDFFYSGLSANLKIQKYEFDYIDRGLHRKRKNIEGEYDIILYNNYKVLVVEVKYNFKKRYLLKFYQNLKNFKALYPEYSHYKLFGAIAGMTFEKDTIDEAQEYGFFVLTQNNQSIGINNPDSFEPNEVK